MKEEAVNNYVGTIDRNPNCASSIRIGGYPNRKARAQWLEDSKILSDFNSIS